MVDSSLVSTTGLDFHSYLPPYRSLLNPHSRYDYRTHSLVPISQNDLAKMAAATVAAAQSANNTKSKFKMKYKSLLGDVSRRTSILSMRINNNNINNIQNTNTTTPSSTSILKTSIQSTQPIQLKNLPIEILEYIFELIDDMDDYKCCLVVSKQFYQLVKPFFYRSLTFTSTYKFAQFVTYLRLNSEVGRFVKEIDLSGIKPSNFGIEEEPRRRLPQQIERDLPVQNNGGGGVANFNMGAAHAGNPREPVVAAPADHVHAHVHQAAPRDLATIPLSSSISIQSNSPTLSPQASWRDWKFKTNPIYTSHPSLTKIHSNSMISTNSNQSETSFQSINSMTSTNKIRQLTKYFKSRKRQRRMNDYKRQRSIRDGNVRNSSSTTSSNPSPSSPSPSTTSSRRLIQSPHPSMNKFLLSYSSSKDIPIGYILHTLNLCPNLTSINLANLSLSVDYEINPKMAYKYQTFDLMNNYPKELVYTVNRLAQEEVKTDRESIWSGHTTATSTAANKASASATVPSVSHYLYGNNYSKINPPPLSNFPPPTSSASSIYSFQQTSPVRKYNSLLPPLPRAIVDLSYIHKGDGKVYLSDLNLKSINTKYLARLQENELLKAISSIHSPPNTAFQMNSLKYLNLSSMIWITKTSVQELLANLLEANHLATSDEESDFDRMSYLSDLDSLDWDHSSTDSLRPQDLVIDLTDSGMYKNLSWAAKIDLKTRHGARLAQRILQDKILDMNEYNTRRDRVRRGRIGENYLRAITS
ncbi:F-box protein Cos111p [[Candida] anglica]|uniref:F-box protein Cos111p n=1 Tax=[Candida] anglica TaxID=148631 RepID=A0ABP0E665_9ASCO